MPRMMHRGRTASAFSTAPTRRLLSPVVHIGPPTRATTRCPAATGLSTVDSANQP